MKRIAPVWQFAANRSRAAAKLGAEARRWRKEAAVANARADHEQARRLDAESRCRRSEDILDLLTRARCDEIAKRNEGVA